VREREAGHLYRHEWHAARQVWDIMDPQGHVVARFAGPERRARDVAEALTARAATGAPVDGRAVSELLNLARVRDAQERSAMLVKAIRAIPSETAPPAVHPASRRRAADHPAIHAGPSAPADFGDAPTSAIDEACFCGHAVTSHFRGRCTVWRGSRSNKDDRRRCPCTSFVLDDARRDQSLTSFSTRPPRKTFRVPPYVPPGRDE
jgi:hypothetical protein